MTWLRRDPNAPPKWQGEMPVTSRYTFGVAGERFFRTIQKEGRILGTFCPLCDHTYVPATAFCERCLSELEEYIDVGTVGEVHTYTALYTDFDGSQRESPHLIAFVRLGDGGLVHYLGDITPDEVKMGMSVEAVFKPTAERKGSILDISHFRPVDV